METNNIRHTFEIRVHTDDHIHASEHFHQEIESALHGKLRKFEKYITTAEVFFTDMNSRKGGPDDKKCAIELHLAGRKPYAVTAKGATLREVFRLSSKKLERVVRDTISQYKKRH